MKMITRLPLLAAIFIALTNPASASALRGLSEEPETLPILNVGVMGHVDHGTATLTQAIKKVMNGSGEGKGKSKQRSKRKRGKKSKTESLVTTIEFETESRKYFLSDFSNHETIVKELIAGTTPLDAAILVVSAADGPMPQTREHVLLAKEVGISNIVVFINNVDLVDDEELLELVEMEIRELLTSFDYNGDEIPVIQGSALAAIQGDRTENGIPSINSLIDALDGIPQPTPDAEQDFLMAIEDVFSITGRGTVVTGRVERGTVSVSEEVDLVGFRELKTVTVTGIEMFRKELDTAVPGENVGLLLRGITKDDVQRGMVVAKTSSIQAVSKFKCAAYLLSKEEGGRHTPLFNGARPQFYLRTTDITGTISLEDGVEMVMPGDNFIASVELINPVALEVGTQFTIREDGATIGLGVVSMIIE